MTEEQVHHFVFRLSRMQKYTDGMMNLTNEREYPKNHMNTKMLKITMKRNHFMKMKDGRAIPDQLMCLGQNLTKIWRRREREKEELSR